MTTYISFIRIVEYKISEKSRDASQKAITATFGPTKCLTLTQIKIGIQ